MVHQPRPTGVYKYALKSLGLNSKTNNGLLFYKIKAATNKFCQKQMMIQQYNRYPAQLLEDFIIHQHLLGGFI